MFVHIICYEIILITYVTNKYNIIYEFFAHNIRCERE